MTENAFHSRLQRPQDNFVAPGERRWFWPIFGAHSEIASSEDYGRPTANLIWG
jgi:hypothetical protein